MKLYSRHVVKGMPGESRSRRKGQGGQMAGRVEQAQRIPGAETFRKVWKVQGWTKMVTKWSSASLPSS